MKKIPVSDTWIGPDETALVNDCLQTHWVSQGKYNRLFEEEFSAYSGCRHGVAVANCTVALHLCGVAIDLGPGDEILVSASTNMASAFSMYYTGAVPVPVDIERDTWQMDVTQIEARLTPRTRAIEVVHLFGHPVDMDPVLEIARAHELYVIEDCAESPGAEYKGRRVGSIGDLGCFSFFANKIITTGEGGMITTNDPELAAKLRRYSSFCYGKTQKFMHDGIGYNYRMPHLSAALGLGQVRRIEAIQAQKCAIGAHYRRRLAAVEGIRIPTVRSWAKPVLWMFNIALDPSFPVSRDQLMQELAERGIETREAFVPINRQRVFLEKGLVKEGDCPVANEIMETGLYLPTGVTLTPQEIDDVCDAVVDISRRGRSS